MRESELKDFYKGKRVLITGHTGFKGTWLTVFLKELGAKVCGYSLPLSSYCFYHDVAPSIEMHVEGDIADIDKVLRTVETFRPEIIIHLASHSSLDRSTEIPDYIFKTNLMGVVNLMEAVRKTSFVKAVVVVTSDKCYQDRGTTIPYKEQDLLGAVDPYSTSKVGQELLTACYMNTFFNEKKVGIATARASNVIGAGDYNISRLMPYLLDCYSRGDVPRIRNPLAVRPWQYVLDVLYGYLLLAKKLYETSEKTIEYNGAYNFGPNNDGFITVEELSKLVGMNFGKNTFKICNQEEYFIKETNVLKLDSTKAKETLGWQTKISLGDAVKLTVDYVQLQKEGKRTSGELCREHITKYMNFI